MTKPVAATSAPPLPPLPPLLPIAALQRRWPVVLGALLTIAMIVGLGRALFDTGRDGGLDGLRAAVPVDPRFYLAFLLLYLAPPIGDFAIFRHLWRVPAAGLVALIKKRIANEVVLGYSGEAYFYAWARTRARLVAAPFGAVKDVGILSAIAGNAVTLALLAAALPLGAQLLSPVQWRAAIGSAGLVVATSLPFLLFSRRVFSLAAPDLWRVFAIHCLRLVAGSLLIALAWHFALPGVAAATWLLLAAARMLVSRLPLIPNKDLLFANLALLLIGRDHALSDLIAFTAAATLLIHVALLLGFDAWGLVRRRG